MSKKRNQYSASFKSKIALAALKGDQTTSEIAARFQIHPTMVSTWKRELLDNASDLFEGKKKANKQSDEPSTDVLYREIGLFVERLWRSVKYECVYLTAFEDGNHLKQGLSRYLRHYNQTRYHQTLDYQTPNAVYYQQPMTLAA